MNLTISDKALGILESLKEFMNNQVIPSEDRYRREILDSGDPYHKPLVMEELQAKARSIGLWNLFLPQMEWGGAGLSNLEFAPICEEMGRSLIGAEVFNCHPPDSGNMGLLVDCGSRDQQEEWLIPLLNGDISSCFAMTEPGVASSDANNIGALITRDGNSYVINGHKGPSTGAGRDVCKFAILAGVSNPDASPYDRQSLVIVPLDAEGVEIVDTWDIYGYQYPLSQAEIRFHDVRVPAANLIQREGDGFRIGQARLGPARIHHCMRAIGLAERALELMCARIVTRMTFGKPIADQGVIPDWIARSRIEIEQARLLTLKTAWMMDELGNKAARKEIAAIKIAVPNIIQGIIDRAVQAHGAIGVTQNTPLAEFWTHARILRILDGPDEVHVRSLARWELKSQQEACESKVSELPVMRAQRY
ncbi:MAG: acyl-CoA dehydrogenase family protein [Alphaproteobacteria bacterium]